MEPRDTEQPDDARAGRQPRREEFSTERMARRTAPSELEDHTKRELWGLGQSEQDRGPYLIELNVQYVDGLAEAAKTFAELFERVIIQSARERGEVDQDEDPWGVTRIAKTYIQCDMSLLEWKTLIAAGNRSFTSAIRISRPVPRRLRVSGYARFTSSGRISQCKHNSRIPFPRLRLMLPCGPSKPAAKASPRR